MKTKEYDFQNYVKEIMSKLSLIHNVNNFTVEKNRISFIMNSKTVIVRKDKDKTNPLTKKIIVTCEDMFPCAFRLEKSDKFKFYDKEINIVVNALDSYFMELIGYPLIEKSAICTRYDFLKWALLPFFIYVYNDEEEINSVQNDILEYLIYSFTSEESNTLKSNDIYGTVICFTGKNTETDIEDCAFIIIASSFEATIFAVRLENGKLVGYDDKDEDIPTYKFKYENYTNSQIPALIKKIIKNYYSFKVCNLNYLVEEDEDIAINDKLS